MAIDGMEQLRHSQSFDEKTSRVAAGSKGYPDLAFWGTIGAMAAIGLTAGSSVDMVNATTADWDDLVGWASASNQALVPAALQPLTVKAAQVLLSP